MELLLILLMEVSSYCAIHVINKYPNIEIIIRTASIIKSLKMQITDSSDDFMLRLKCYIQSIIHQFQCKVMTLILPEE
ncbi:hypothetical protein T08_10575 [Trichinella sp. T8]|nr:hypothetical protein T08_10575 [Trichinella sp. T8]